MAINTSARRFRCRHRGEVGDVCIRQLLNAGGRNINGRKWEVNHENRNYRRKNRKRSRGNRRGAGRSLEPRQGHCGPEGASWRPKTLKEFDAVAAELSAAERRTGFFTSKVEGPKLTWRVFMPSRRRLPRPRRRRGGKGCGAHSRRGGLIGEAATALKSNKAAYRSTVGELMDAARKANMNELQFGGCKA